MPRYSDPLGGAPVREGLTQREHATVEIVRRPGARPRAAWWLAIFAVLVAGALAIWALVGDRPGAAPPPATPALEEARRIYGGLRPGMSREEVERALGGPGEEISWRRLQGTVIETFYWNPTSGSTIIVTFRNGEVVRTSELGLY